MGKELKFAGGVPSLKLKAPPKSCIPSSAKIRMKRKRRKSSEMMERIELSNEITRLRSEDQYLLKKKLSKSCQKKLSKKLSKSCQKSCQKSCKKVVKKLQKVDKR
jgi:hypothetical protein